MNTEKTDSGVPLTMNAEVQFKGYSDGSRTGPCITFRLSDAKMLDAWRGEEGQRYRLVAVKIGDDETPVPPKSAAAPAPGPAVARTRMAPLCEWSVLRCAEPDFQRWAYMQALKVLGSEKTDAVRMRAKGPSAQAELVARHMVLELCGVDSRKKLDTDPAAAKALHEFVRKPYAAWLAQQRQGVPA